jgi:CRISPR/Cas system endoribonuclease Cas6 (RAMP superfamily)
MRAETQIQFINFSQEEFTELISKSVKSQFEELVKESTKEQPKEQNELLTRNETSKFLKVSTVTISKWTKDGLITPKRMGTKVFYSKAELIEVLNKSNRL